MRGKRWFATLCVAIVACLGVLVQPEPTAAGCGYCWILPGLNAVCQGVNRQWGFMSGPVNCDPCRSCKCPLPASQWNLTYNECNGQVP